MTLRMSRGDTPLFTMSIEDYAGHALDVSTVQEIWFTAKYGYNDLDDDAVFQKTLGHGITVTDSVLGQLEIRLDSADTDSVLNPTNLKYDVQVKDASGAIYTVDSGLLRVSPDVTRDTV